MITLASSEKIENNFYKPDQLLLKESVRYFFQAQRINVPLSQEIILPKGAIEVIFNFYDSEKTKFTINDYSTMLPRCFISGFRDCPTSLDLPQNQYFFGVVFHPLAAKYIFKIKLDEVTNLCVDLTLIHPDFNSLWHRMAEQSTFMERVKVVSEWILQEISDLSPREHMINRFLNPDTTFFSTVSELSNNLCYSSRQLSRKFIEIAGMNSEQMLNFMRYLKSIELIYHTALPLSEVAYRCNFADQAHFSRTFKDFTLLSPKVYRQKKSDIAGHYYENV
jgi:AraC-like DNA-binding protein